MTFSVVFRGAPAFTWKWRPSSAVSTADGPRGTWHRGDPGLPKIEWTTGEVNLPEGLGFWGDPPPYGQAEPAGKLKAHVRHALVLETAAVLVTGKWRSWTQRTEPGLAGTDPPVFGRTTTQQMASSCQRRSCKGASSHVCFSSQGLVEDAPF